MADDYIPRSRIITPAKSRTELRRYTDLSSVIDTLTRKRIVLLDPSLWDDRNDSHYIDQFKRRSGHASVLALCLTQAAETYHHWRVFAGGSGGMCIAFRKKRFLDYMSSVEGVRCSRVIYRSSAEMKRLGCPLLPDVPFIKRKAFRDEKEHRIIFCSSIEKPTHDLEIPLDLIDRIIFNPWVPRSLYISTRTLLRGIPGCENLSMTRSVLRDSDAWKAFLEAPTPLLDVNTTRT